MSNDSHKLKTLAEQYPEYVKNPHSWAAMVERYRDDVANWGGSAQMLSLVEYLEGQDFASLFSPGTSHMMLVICTEAYPQQPVDSLSIWWDDRIKAYKLDYYEAGHSKPDKRMCTESQVRDVLELKLLRMQIAHVGEAV
ncbi:MAG TPA: hypothetical protein VF658_09820 [Pyrinomonadaceae bacterium]|jgi:hypothetical protein